MTDRTVGFAQIGFDFDYRKLQRDLDDAGRRALPEAASRFLTHIAYDARDRLSREVGRAFDRPTGWIGKSFRVNPAKVTDGERMEASVYALTDQAKVLAFQIFGGEREKGDAGAGKWDVFAHSDKLTKAGGVDRRYLKRTAERNRKEKKDRADLRSKRAAMRIMRDEGRSGPFERTSWVAVSKNRPGVFFGEVSGLKGYWERPKRTKAARKRKKGVLSVQPRGDNRPKLLIAMKDSVNYRPLFRYDYAVMEAFRVKGTSAYWQRALNHVTAKHAAADDRKARRS